MSWRFLESEGPGHFGGSEVLCGYLHTVFQLFQGPGDGGDDQRLAEEDLG